MNYTRIIIICNQKDATVWQNPQYGIRKFVLGEFLVCLGNGHASEKDRPFEERPQDGKYISHQLQVVG